MSSGESQLMSGGTYGLHLQDQRITQARNKHEAGSCACCLLHAGLLFNPEDGSDVFHKNISDFH
jgi:hypothetical protein